MCLWGVASHLHPRGMCCILNCQEQALALGVYSYKHSSNMWVDVHIRRAIEDENERTNACMAHAESALFTLIGAFDGGDFLWHPFALSSVIDFGPNITTTDEKER
jgi:hypothetical protein